MKSENRHVLLLLDNCSAHQILRKPTNIDVQFLPPNTTAVLQPMDQGVIQNLKCHYRGHLIRRLIADLEAGSATEYKINVKDAILLLTQSWKAVTQVTIRNCFVKAGFIKPSQNDACENSDSVISYQNIFDNLRNFMCVPTDINFVDYVDADMDVLPRAVLSDKEIVDSIVADSIEADVIDDNSDDEDEEVLPVAKSTAEALRMISQLRDFCMKRGASDSDLRCTWELENLVSVDLRQNLRQPQITDFFHREK